VSSEAAGVAADDHRLARRIAAEAGRELLRLRRLRADAKTLGAEGDRSSHRLICDRLAAARPADPVRSEEAADDGGRSGGGRLWVVDPLDGTREFTEAGRTDWSVHVALSVGGRAVVGAVALPAQRVTLSTAAPPTLPPMARRRLRMVVSRTRPPEFAVALGESLEAEISGMGSVGAKAMSVVCGAADIYVHAGGQYEWDSAAPVAVADAAGLHSSRLSGDALEYGRPDPYLPDLLICRPELADRVLELLARLGAVA